MERIFLEVFIFGSVVEGKTHPLSDIDVAIVLKRKSKEEERMKFYRKVKEKIGLFHPFEFHIITKDEWENWYKRFIKRFEKL